ncbi:MAG: hypothetical protein N2053_10640, partial [Chitinispirillaceae bacterium]|nr:hypothetical protein [Chitinispirillaceae bacterium]
IRDRYNGTLSIKVGDILLLKGVKIGGFVELRNEKRFNIGLFPNHNWRGFISAHTYYPLVDIIQTVVFAFSGIEHESAHATMGIVEHTTNPFEMIYDHTYRKMCLNSIYSGIGLRMFDEIQNFNLRSSINFYFLSKNTPELSNSELTNTIGFSGGMNYRYLFKKNINLFISFYERLILKSKAKREGSVYIVNENGVSTVNISYPVINTVNTFSVTFGITMPFFISRKNVDIYFKYLFGNIYGYVDSREKRHIFGGGISFRLI